MEADPYKYFRPEAREILEGLTRGALALERGAPDPEAVARVLRLAHTLKGAARVVKQIRIAELAHLVEEILSPYRDTRAAPPSDKVDRLLRTVDEIGTAVAAIDRDGPAPSAAPAPEEPARFLRVPGEDLEDLVEGLADAAGGLSRSREALARAAPAREVDLRVEEAEAELLEVQARVERLRLVPIRGIATPLERVARDAARALGRRIDFHLAGEDGRLEAPVLGTLLEALQHAVRNAVAHGIEPEEARRAAGKPPAGKVEVRVERRGDRYAFLCVDDGRGIDVEAVRLGAVRLGRATAAQAAALTPEESCALLLRGGISTAAPGGELAGRGIGLDAVRAAASRLRGSASIRTDPGRGTVLEIEVPASAASVRAVLVESGPVRAAIPVGAVVRAQGVGPVEGDRPVASLSLDRLAGRRTAPRVTVILRTPSGPAALGVERVRGVRSILVKPVPAAAAALPCVAGAAFGPLGEPCLLLDPDHLAEALGPLDAEEAPEIVRRPPILVVDDSLTTRMLEQNILETAGYEIALATGGLEGLAKARERRFGLFLVDVEMPDIDGFQFLEEAGRDPALRDVPSILVTSRNSGADRERARRLGAKAYVVKGEFDQRRFLETIRGLVG